MRSQYTQTQERASGLGRKSYRPQWRGAIMSALAILGLLLSFIAFPQPVSADPGPPTVNGLFWGDGDHEIYEFYAKAYASDSKLYTYVDDHNNRLYVALVVDGNWNDNVFDATYSDYQKSAGWPRGGNVRPARHLTNSEFASFTATICGTTYEWGQGYAQQGSNDAKSSVNTEMNWVSSHLNDKGFGGPPAGIESSSSLVWNMNNYASNLANSASLFTMEVNGNNPETWKSPFDPDNPDTVIGLDGWPEGGVISATAPITYSAIYEWEWAMVYEWSVDLPDGCSYTVYSPFSHHSPAKKPGENDFFDPPTAITLTALDAPTNAYVVMPVFGLLLSAGAIVVIPRRRRS